MEFCDGIKVLRRLLSAMRATGEKAAVYQPDAGSANWKLRTTHEVPPTHGASLTTPPAGAEGRTSISA